ncbi:hypothetical protein [Sporolactobacillus terrae]|uniref:Uncharacterized protein n=1 Tax=Sporolactobacillus terrae TaxID=269673 RepID=A0A5K7WZI7_9BACL|nr:hypothetical protein [Sporolactobacillus terrae]BBO00046.1 hypothetical protein St703_27500 [Sporolactobacillus terrae]
MIEKLQSRQLKRNKKGMDILDNQIRFGINNTHLIAELKRFLHDKFDFIDDFSKVMNWNQESMMAYLSLPMIQSLSIKS